jgi:hypothetical protein
MNLKITLIILLIFVIIIFFRLLKTNKEHFIYGIDDTLLKYSGIPKEKKKKHFTKIHGIPEISIDTDKDRKNPSHGTWCETYLANKENLDYCKRFNKKLTNDNIIGYYIIYSDYVKKDPIYNNGLLVFYNHTWAGSNYGKDEIKKHEKYINDIKKLEKQFSPIHVILYYKDYNNKKLTDILKKNKLNYITNGPTNNSEFYKILAENIQKYRYCTSSIIGTHVWCCLYLNRYFFIYGDGEPCSSEISHWGKTCKDAREISRKTYPLLEYDYFLKHKNDPNYIKKLKELGDEKVGLKYKKTKEQIKNLYI